MAVSPGRKGRPDGARGKSNERSGDSAPGNDERRGMAGAGAGRHRHEPCLFRRIGDAPHAAAPRRSRRQARSWRIPRRRRPIWPTAMPASPAGPACAWRSRSAPPISPPACRTPGSGAARSSRLTGHKEPSFQHRNSYQEIPHAPLFAAGDQILDPGRRDRRIAAPAAPRLARRAGRHAAPDPSRLQRLAGRRDRARADRRAAGHRNRGAAAFRLHRPVADERDIERAAALLTGARRLVIVAGDGALPRPAPGRRCWRWPRRSPRRWRRRSARAASSRPRIRCRPASPAAIRRRPPTASCTAPTCVLFVGCDTGDQVTLNWRMPALDTKIVQIDADPLEIGRSYPNTTGVVGDPKATRGPPRRGRRPARRATAVLCRGGGADRRRLARRHGAAGRQRTRRRSAVERLCAEITRALPEDGILVADTGYSGIWTGTMIDLNGAGQTYLRAAGSLGWAFPASLGAKCARRTAQGRVLHRRRRVLLPPGRARDGAALRHRRRRSSSTTIPASART